MKAVLVLLLLLAPAGSALAFQFAVNGCVAHSQVGAGVSVPIGGGLYRYEVTFQVTNNAPHALRRLSFVNTVACEGPSTNAGCSASSSWMTWNNPARRWDPRPGGSVTATPNNPASFLTLLPAQTDVFAQPSFGVDVGDSVASFAVDPGDVPPGVTRSYVVEFVLPTNQTTFGFLGQYVADGTSCSVAIPALERRAAWLLAAGLMVAAAARMRRRRT